MAIEIKFRVKDDTELYDSPIDVVNRAAYLSQSVDGIPMTMERGVKYTRSQEFKWTSLGSIALPRGLTEGAATAEEHDPLKRVSPEELMQRIYKR